MAKVQVTSLDPVDFASAGAIGEPGHREFYIQGTKSGVTVSVLIEKQQMQQIANEAINFLNTIASDFGQEQYASPEDFDSAVLKLPIETYFRSQSISIVFDELTQYLTLILRESDIEPEDNYFDDSEVDNDFTFYTEALVENKILKLTMTRTQLRALAVKGNMSVEGGREICELCLLPKDPSSHICPRFN